MKPTKQARHHDGHDHSHKHPCHSSQVKRLNRIIGQLEGIRKMIDERRYCPDILTQTKAAVSALKVLQGAILESHLTHCVHDAMKAGTEAEQQKKVSELMKIFMGLK